MRVHLALVEPQHLPGEARVDAGEQRVQVEDAVIAEFLKTPEWQAVTEVEFRDPAVLNETVAVTLESPAMWNPIAEREGITDKEFQKHYDAAVTGGTQIIRVRFIDEDPERATRIATGHRCWVAVASFAGSTGEGYDPAAGGSGIWGPDGAAVVRAGTGTGEHVTTTLTRG